jgi:hypothetical protein
MNDNPNPVTATHGKPMRRETRERGACIRVGTGGSATGNGGTQAFWFTVAEARALLAELAAAIRTAEGLAVSGLELVRREAA